MEALRRAVSEVGAGMGVGEEVWETETAMETVENIGVGAGERLKAGGEEEGEGEAVVVDGTVGPPRENEMGHRNHNDRRTR